jgi:hypothetical protein
LTYDSDLGAIDPDVQAGLQQVAASALFSCFDPFCFCVLIAFRLKSKTH